jgi:hypothetical protein
VSIYPFHFMPSQAKVFSDLFHVHGGYSATWDNCWLASITAMSIKFSIVISKVLLTFFSVFSSVSYWFIFSFLQWGFFVTVWKNHYVCSSPSQAHSYL